MWNTPIRLPKMGLHVPCTAYNRFDIHARMLNCRAIECRLQSASSTFPSERMGRTEARTPENQEAMKQSRFPPGWDEERVQRVLAHYETQSEEEAVAEDEAAYEDENQTVMEIPNDLVPAVRELLAKRGA